MFILFLVYQQYRGRELAMNIWYERLAPPDLRDFHSTNRMNSPSRWISYTRVLRSTMITRWSNQFQKPRTQMLERSSQFNDKLDTSRAIFGFLAGAYHFLHGAFQSVQWSLGHCGGRSIESLEWSLPVTHLRCIRLSDFYLRRALWFIFATLDYLHSEN